MGKSFRDFLVRSQKDFETVQELKKKHNEAKEDEVGEVFFIEYMLYFDNEYWLILGNYGGDWITSPWIQTNKPKEMVVIWPFAKPQGWEECKEVYEGDKIKKRQTLNASISQKILQRKLSRMIFLLPLQLLWVKMQLLPLEARKYKYIRSKKFYFLI